MRASGDDGGSEDFNVEKENIFGKQIIVFIKSFTNNYRNSKIRVMEKRIQL